MQTLTLVVLAPLALGADSADAQGPLGKPIDNSKLQDHLGTSHELTDWHDKRADLTGEIEEATPQTVTESRGEPPRG